MASLVIKGTARVQRNLARLGQRGVHAVERALVQEAETIMGESKEQVPVDIGTLRASGHVQPPTQSFGRVSVDLGYGGPASAYAIVQHENLSYRHRVGKAKYLEDPFKARAGKVPKTVAEFVRREARAVGTG